MFITQYNITSQQLIHQSIITSLLVGVQTAKYDFIGVHQ